MKHEEVIEALKSIADTGIAKINGDDLQQLKSYNLIDVVANEGNKKAVTYTLTKKGRVMLKANLK